MTTETLSHIDTNPVNGPAFSQDRRSPGHCRQPKFIVMLANRVRETGWMDMVSQFHPLLR